MGCPLTGQNSRFKIKYLADAAGASQQLQQQTSDKLLRTKTDAKHGLLSQRFAESLGSALPDIGSLKLFKPSKRGPERDLDATFVPREDHVHDPNRPPATLKTCSKKSWGWRCGLGAHPSPRINAGGWARSGKTEPDWGGAQDIARATNSAKIDNFLAGLNDRLRGKSRHWADRGRTTAFAPKRTLAYSALFYKSRLPYRVERLSSARRLIASRSGS